MKIEEVNENLEKYNKDQPEDERIALVSINPEKMEEIKKDISNKIKLLIEDKNKKEKEIKTLENKIKNLLKISRKTKGEDEKAGLN